MFFDREGVPSAIDHHQLIFPDQPIADDLLETGEGHCRCRFNRHALRPGQGAHGGKRFGIRNGFHQAAVFLDDVEQVGIYFPWIARGENDDVRIGDDGFCHSMPGLEGSHHGRAAFGLDDSHFGKAIDKAHSMQFFKALKDTQRPEAATDRLDIPIGSMPAKLLNDLVGDGFHRLAGRDGSGTSVIEQVAALCKLGGDLFGLIVISADPDHFGPKKGGFA